MNRKSSLRLLALPILLAGAAASADAPANDQQISASPSEIIEVADAEVAVWQHILGAYVTDDGGFRYEALMANETDLAMLHEHLASLAAADLSTMEGQVKLAFLINAYNAYTVGSMVELWPVSGVLEEDGFFDGREHTVAGNSMTLNTLENEHIRAAFGEARIHFVVNCASTGCPWLSSTMATADNLEGLLAAQSSSYVQRTTIFDREAGTVQVSQIFDWFAGDFEATGGVRAFLVANMEGDDAAFVADEATTVGFFDYDWSPNAR
ncbi:MAG: hypothetical protein ACJAYU_003233 [Bradymonadia bacterium]|jgi:hypothetical protein